MGTRSNIGILNEDGTVDYIYCHWDGYISHNGKILNEYYSEEASVWGLIAAGDMSTLGATLSECKFYDNGEMAERVTYRDYTKEHFESHVYLFTPGKGWEVRMYGDDFWTDLNKALETMEI